MADKFGVLGTATGKTIGSWTVYTVPPGKAAKLKLFGSFQASGSVGTGTLIIEVGGIDVALTGAMTANFTTYTNGGAGLLSAPAAALQDGRTPGTTIQPAPPIYYLSEGQAVRYRVGVADIQNANLQAVGVEVDLTL